MKLGEYGTSLCILVAYFEYIQHDNLLQLGLIVIHCIIHLGLVKRKDSDRISRQRQSSTARKRVHTKFCSEQG